MNNYDYPLGSDTGLAPWNQKEETSQKEVEVTVSITLSKTLKILTNPDINNTQAVENQYYLPQDAGTLIQAIADGIYKNKASIQSIANDLSDWYVDEMEVIPN